GFVNEISVGAISLGGEKLHSGKIFGTGLGGRRLQQSRLERGGGQDLEVAAAQFRVRVLARNHFALLGDADGGLHRAERLRENRLIAGPAAASDRATAAVEEAQADLMPPKHLDERDLRFVEFPARGQKA